MARELGLEGHGRAVRTVRCSTAASTGSNRCDPALRELYLDAEDDDGYLRDRCVFDADITIEEPMQVQVRYANDVFLNYTLCAYSPWEGLEIKFHGTKGELTHRHIEVHGVFGGQRDKSSTRT